MCLGASVKQSRGTIFDYISDFIIKKVYNSRHSSVDDSCGLKGAGLKRPSALLNRALGQCLLVCNKTEKQLAKAFVTSSLKEDFSAFIWGRFTSSLVSLQLVHDFYVLFYKQIFINYPGCQLSAAFNFWFKGVMECNMDGQRRLKSLSNFSGSEKLGILLPLEKLVNVWFSFNWDCRGIMWILFTVPVWEIPSNKRHRWSNICRLVKFMGSVLIYHRLAIDPGYAQNYVSN